MPLTEPGVLLQKKQQQHSLHAKPELSSLDL